MTTDPNFDGVFLSRSGKNSWLQTASGGRVSVLNPLQKEINIQDIAGSLAKQCRFNGHCQEFYSVAEHCVRGVKLIQQIWGSDSLDLQKAFLLHDASEAYIGDMIKPVKVMDPVFNAIEAKFEKVIQSRFNLNPNLYIQVKLVDQMMLVWEKRDLLPNSEDWPNLPSIEGYDLEKLIPFEWKDAEMLYLNTYNKLFNKGEVYVE
jgi:hypothetical protein